MNFLTSTENSFLLIEESAPSQEEKWSVRISRFFRKMVFKKKIFFSKNGRIFRGASLNIFALRKHFVIAFISQGETVKHLLELTYALSDACHISPAPEAEEEILYLPSQIDLENPSKLQLRPEYRERDPLAGGRRTMRFYEITNRDVLAKNTKYICKIESSFPTASQIDADPDNAQKNRRGYIILHVNVACLEEEPYVCGYQCGFQNPCEKDR